MKTAKVLLLILVLMIVSCLVATGLADSQSGGYKYTVLPDGTAQITKYSGYSNTVVIPDKLDGIPVSSIGKNAFMYANVDSIVIGNNITSIGENAFFGCKATKISITSKTIVIGSKSFSCCNNIQEFSICSNNVSIGYSAFMYTKPLSSITWTLYDQNDVSEVIIDETGFFGADLVSLSIPCDSLIIGKKAFSCTNNLVSLYSPCKTVTIDEAAFMYASAMTSFRCPNANQGRGSIGSTAFFSSGLVEFVVPECIVEIGDKAFSCSSSLMTISIPTNVTKIGNNAFLYAGGSKMVANVVKGSYADTYCTNNRIQKNYVTREEISALAASQQDVNLFVETSPVQQTPTATPYVTSVPTVKPTQTPVPTNASDTAEWICSVCSNNATGNFCSNCGAAKPVQESANWICASCGNDSSGNFCSNCGSRKPNSQGSLTVATSSPLPAATPTPKPTAIGGNIQVSGDFSYTLVDNGVQITRYNGNSSRVTISSELVDKKVVSIGPNAFQNCTSIETITIWADLTSIGDFAFAGCTKLTKISIPGETTYLGAYAFDGCTSLESITIWGEITAINDGTFRNCTSLKKISIPSSAQYIGNSAFRNCTSLESATIWGDSNIGHYAFQGCSSLQKISISSSTQYIGNYAFAGCTSLSRVTMWGRSTAIGVGAFDNCPNLSNKPQYPVGNVPEETHIESDIGASSTPIPTVEPTATPKPTAKPTVEPLPAGSKPSAITSETNYQPGVYRVGVDIEPGKYYFIGTGAADILYNCPNSDFSEGTYDKEGSIWKSGDTTAIMLKAGTYFKITLHDVKVSPYSLSVAKDDEELFAVGTYHVGEDIPAGKYYFTGTDSADILYGCPDDLFVKDTYIREGSIWKAGDITAIDLKENTYFRITIHPVLVKNYDLSIPDDSEVKLAVGVYHIGIDIVPGTYVLVGTGSADILYGCSDDSFAEGTYVKEGSIWSEGDTVVLRLEEGTYMKVTLNELMISKFVPLTTIEAGASLPVGVYLVGVDIPAGDYKMVGTGSADIYYNCPNDRFESGSYKKDGSIWSAGDTVNITLKENTYLRITLHGVTLQ